jgi:hypothetical protein
MKTSLGALADPTDRDAFSRLRSATIISMIWRRRTTRSASGWVASSASGRKSGLGASTKRAIRLWCELLGHNIVVGKSVERQS